MRTNKKDCALLKTIWLFAVFFCNSALAQSFSGDNHSKDLPSSLLDGQHQYQSFDIAAAEPEKKGLVSFIQKISGSDSEDSSSPATEVELPTIAPNQPVAPRVRSSSPSSNAKIIERRERRPVNDIQTMEMDEEWEEDNSSEPIPNKRPKVNYRTHRPSPVIAKESYSIENQHLPKVRYVDDYTRLLFDSAVKGDLDILRAMVSYFGDTEIRDSQGNTPLLYATMAGNRNSVRSLLGMGASTEAKNFDGIASLHVATKATRVDLVELLLHKGADPNITDPNHKTPLILAAERDADVIAQMLLKAGAETEIRMKTGDNALHAAVQNKSFNTAYLLINAGANTETRNFNGYTPLMLTGFTGDYKMTTLLLNAGADTERVDARGRGAIKIAAGQGYVKVAELIASEDIRRKILVDRMLEMQLKKQQTKAVQPYSRAVKQAKDPNIKAKNIKIPLPVYKPEMPKPVKVDEAESKPKPESEKKKQEQENAPDPVPQEVLPEKEISPTEPKEEEIGEKEEDTETEEVVIEETSPEEQESAPNQQKEVQQTTPVKEDEGNRSPEENKQAEENIEEIEEEISVSPEQNGASKKEDPSLPPMPEINEGSESLGPDDFEVPGVPDFPGGNNFEIPGLEEELPEIKTPDLETIQTQPPADPAPTPSPEKNLENEMENFLKESLKQKKNYFLSKRGFD